MLISSPEIESKTVFINAVETPCKIKYTSGPLGGCLWLDQDVPNGSVIGVRKEHTHDILRNVRKIGLGVYACEIDWGFLTETERKDRLAKSYDNLVADSASLTQRLSLSKSLIEIVDILRQHERLVKIFESACWDLHALGFQLTHTASQE